MVIIVIKAFISILYNKWIHHRNWCWRRKTSSFMFFFLKRRFCMMNLSLSIWWFIWMHRSPSLVHWTNRSLFLIYRRLLVSKLNGNYKFIPIWRILSMFLLMSCLVLFDCFFHCFKFVMCEVINNQFILFFGNLKNTSKYKHLVGELNSCMTTLWLWLMLCWYFHLYPWLSINIIVPKIIQLIVLIILTTKYV